MSKPKSTNTQATSTQVASTQARRFSGPELSDLLDQVAREHGADAAISAVNKIRSGGVAGFFCREEFEVVVQATDAGSEEPGADVPAKSDIAPSSRLGRATPDAATEPTISVDRQEGLSADAPIAPPTIPTAPPEVFAGPKPVAGTSVPEDRFRSLLEQRIDETSDADQVVSDRFGSARLGPDQRGLDRTVSAPVWPKVEAPQRPVRRSAPVAAPRTAPQLQPIVPAPGLPISQETVSGGVGVLTPAALTATSHQVSDFWLRLQRAQHELASFMPLASTAVATIGPLSLTTPIVKRLRTTPGLESADVIVLTDRAEIVSEPSWQLVRSGHQLVDAATERGDWPTLLLIDVPVELPNWLAPLENRLRTAGVGLFRYAVPGNPTAEQLDRYRLASDVPYVIDLISRVSPQSLVDFVARRHPIASVAGADLNAELLVAMREQVDLGS